jgi:hypothetical protein
VRASCKAIASVVVFFVTVCSTMAAQDAKATSVLDMSEFVRDWEISKQFTLDVANAMPADLYTFKPAPEEMSFGEQINHIALANAYRFNQITGAKTPFAIDLKKSTCQRQKKCAETAGAVV